MALVRFTFGGGPSDFAILAPSTTGRVVNSAPNIVSGGAWSAETGGTQYTDLLALGADPAPIATDADGFIYPFQGPAGVTVLWADFGSGHRLRLAAQETALLTGPDGNIDPAKVPTKLDVTALAPHTVLLPAPSGGDDAAAISDAIAAAVAACQADGTNVCAIQFKAGIYQANRAPLRQTLATGVGNNTQIPIPWVPKTAQKVIVHLLGAAPAAIFPMYGQSVKQSEGTVIQSTITGDGAYSQPSIIGGPSIVPDSLTFSNVMVHLDALTLRGPDNPSVAGFDGYYCAEVDIGSIRVDTDVIQGEAIYSGNNYAGIACPTNPTGVGVIFPANNNNTVQRANSIAAIGWWAGVLVGEHTDLKYYSALRCWVGAGINRNGGHAANGGYWSIEWCPYSVAVMGYGGSGIGAGTVLVPLNVALLDIEDAGYVGTEWSFVQAHFEDAGNVLHGQINYVHFSDPYGPAVIHGASNITLVDMGRPPVPPQIKSRVAGNVPVTWGTFAAIDPALDITMQARVGDFVEVSPNFLVDNSTVALCVDVQTLVAGVVVNTFSGGATYALMGWHCPSGVNTQVTGSMMYRVTAADLTAPAGLISGPTVTLRVVVKLIDGGAASRTVLASSATPLFIAVRNGRA